MATLDSAIIGYTNCNLPVSYETNEDFLKTINVDLSIVKHENSTPYNTSPINQHLVYHQAHQSHNHVNTTLNVLSTSINYENSSSHFPPTPPSPVNQAVENYIQASSLLPCQLDCSQVNSISQTKQNLINGDQLTRQQIRASNSVAKRNERERKRVKNVNLGFQKLRNHIPNNAKKMSKVETLRSAVKYIRQLQEILNESGQSNHTTELLFNILNNSGYSSSSSTQVNSNLENCNGSSTLDYFDIAELLS